MSREPVRQAEGGPPRDFHEVGVAVLRLIQEVTRAKLARIDPELARRYLR